MKLTIRQLQELLESLDDEDAIIYVTPHCGQCWARHFTGKVTDVGVDDSGARWVELETVD